MSTQRVLINGVLTQGQVGGEIEFSTQTAKDLHIVNLGSPVLLIARVGLQYGCVNVALRFGGTAIIKIEAQLPSESVIRLGFEPIEPTLNFTEKAFTNEVRCVLRGGSEKSITNGIDGAAPVSLVTDRCSTRKPAHAREIVLSMPDVNSFDDARGEKLCVAKKASKPRSLQSCPKIDAATNIDVIARRAVSGEATWKQCAASFSTMMRHFQKAPGSFKWECDAEKRTIITTL